MKKRFWYIILLAVALLLAWRLIGLFGSKSDRAGFGGGRPSVAVEVDQVHRGPVSDIRLFTGTIHPLYRYLVAPKISGRVVRFDKRIGDFVKRDEIIARIDDAEYQQVVNEAQANLQIARASLNEAEAQLDLARKEFDRAESLREQGLSAPSDMDAVRSRLDAQQARVAVAEAQVQQRVAALEAARIRLSYTLLRASEPGYIGERLVDEGALLSSNSAVASVLGIDTVFVRSTIIERDYGKVRIGQTAEIRVDAYPDEIFEGRVSRIAPMLREESRVAEMEVVVPNSRLDLKPGMFAKVYVVLEHKDDALLIPSKAIVRRDNVDGIFSVIPGEPPTAKFIPIEMGIQSEMATEITDPTSLSGDVVTLGQHLLEDGGALILPRDTSKSSEGNGESNP